MQRTLRLITLHSLPGLLALTSVGENRKMNFRYLLVTALTLLTLLNLAETKSQSLATRNLDSLARIVNMETSKLTSPALEHRKTIRREMQRNGYANTLMDVVAQDGLNAVLSFFKVKLLIEYSISHRPIIIQIPIQGGEGRTYDVALQDDWTFPANPWKK